LTNYPKGLWSKQHLQYNILLLLHQIHHQAHLERQQLQIYALHFLFNSRSLLSIVKSKMLFSDEPSFSTIHSSSDLRSLRSFYCFSSLFFLNQFWICHENYIIRGKIEIFMTNTMNHAVFVMTNSKWPRRNKLEKW
jgi:hypothetical protein